MAITIKNDREIGKMREAGHVVSVCHQRVQASITPGITTDDLNTVVRDTLAEMNATSNFLGHHGFPGVICASVNDEIVHGIPGKRRLNDGDIIAVDIGAIVDGFHGDSAWTYAVGDVSDEAKRLLQDTEDALYAGITVARAGNRIGAIGAAIEAFARPLGYGIVEGYGGHGIGRQMWEEPHIPNLESPDHGPRMRAGMTLAIEPMLNLGNKATRVLDDNWTVVTADGSWSAHFEHTVVVTDGEPEILTKRLASVLH
ncbi:MAG TPA: type I methionyl aminopeptidase [Thermomicrobiales bacterium]|nr:type I methionyl aminopeptidase [Thermomicrobiales bacterium]